MKNKGFTLIELMAIIIITSTIGILSYASLSSTIKNNKLREQNIFENSLISAAKLYMLASQEKYSNMESENFDTKILCGEMIKNKYLNRNINNPTDINIYAYYVRVYKDGDNFLTYDVEYDLSLIDSNGLRYSEPLLNGSDPVLTNDMIPVTYDSNGKTIKADINQAWYNYGEKRWANVVILRTSNKGIYDDSPAGTLIDETFIQGYFVWIPRYKYKLFNVSGNKATYTDGICTANCPQSIEIVFENKSKKSSGNSDGEYLTVPGFTFGNKELSGVWVGKFKSSKYNSESTILPNQIVTTNTNVSEMFALGNKFNEYISNGDAHMMKLGEYSTMIYLTHSIYGINEKPARNINSNYMTGCSSFNINNSYSEECINAFGTASDGIYKQSSTGNQYGVFDMVGPSSQYVMFFKTDAEGTPFVGEYEDVKLGSSGFTGKLLDGTNYSGVSLPNSKYYDTLPNTDWDTLVSSKKSLGYIFSEFSGWYEDVQEWDKEGPLFHMNESFLHGSRSGIFAFYSDNGAGFEDSSYREALVVE